MRLLPSLLVACLFLGACDRFADEEQVLDVRVFDPSGAAVSRAEVHALLHFSPPLPSPASPPVAYQTEGQTNISFEVFRRADAARVLDGEVGLVGAGTHTFTVADLPLRNGLYDLRVLAGRTLVQETAFFLNRTPQRSDQYPPAGLTDAGGRVQLAYENLSLGSTLPVEAGPVAPYTVTDSLTLWIVPPGRAPQARRLRLQPVGTTHVTVTLE